jgi:hypothetical protein
MGEPINLPVITVPPPYSSFCVRSHMPPQTRRSFQKAARQPPVHTNPACDENIQFPNATQGSTKDDVDKSVQQPRSDQKSE